MARVVRPGGLVGAYLWDFGAQGFPFEPIHSVLRSMGSPPPLPPSVNVSDATALRKVWEDAGFSDVDTTRIEVSRTYGSFDEFWNITALGSASIRGPMELMSTDEVDGLKSAVKATLPTARDGKITYSAVANAVKGYVPLS